MFIVARAEMCAGQQPLMCGRADGLIRTAVLGRAKQVGMIAESLHDRTLLLSVGC
jgi:hypothetical protein